MAGILDDVMGAVGAVSTITQQVADPQTPNPPTDERLAALENFVVTWGPVLEKLAPMFEKL